MNKTLKSVTALILALPIIIACASCANNSNVDKNTLDNSDNSGESIVISGEDDTSVNDSYGLPSDLNYNNETISIFHRADRALTKSLNVMPSHRTLSRWRFTKETEPLRKS